MSLLHVEHEMRRVDQRRRRAEQYVARQLERQARVFSWLAHTSTDDEQSITWAKGAGTLRLTRSMYLQGNVTVHEARIWLEAAHVTLVRHFATDLPTPRHFCDELCTRPHGRNMTDSQTGDQR